MTVTIQTPTPNIEESIAFYTKCGFTKIFDSNHFTDGKSIIEVNENRFTRSGIKLLARSWKNEVAELKKITKVIENENGFLLGDSSGTWIYLTESNEEIQIPENCPTSLFGNNQGLSIETIDIEKSVQIWNMLGFETQSGSAEQGWISLANKEGVVLNLMVPNCCPHLFLNPSISYFNGTNNLEIIQAIRKTKIPIKEEITHFNKEEKVDNIVMADPGNIGFFIFND